MPERFKLHPEPHERREATFKIGRSTFSTIQNGRFGAALLVPHLTLPVYGAYWVGKQLDLLPSNFETGLGLFIALTEGLAAGAIVGLSIIRYSAAGKAIKGRRIEKTATDSEALKQQRIEVALVSAIYVLLACILWEYLVHSPYSPMVSPESRSSASGLITSSQRFKDYLNNEAIIPPTQQLPLHQAGVGVNINFDDVVRGAKEHIDKAPKIRIGAPPKPKSEFLRAVEWVLGSFRPKRTVGLWELGPKNWEP